MSLAQSLSLVSAPKPALVHHKLTRRPPCDITHPDAERKSGRDLNDQGDFMR